MGELEIGSYTGKLILESLESGHQMKTVLDFGFLDDDGRHWPVPPGTSVDQASIPKALWSLLGRPWEGKYRRALVVHDYHCAVRSANWRSVHRMFYRAMLVSGVSPDHAKLIYAGVYFAGLRWADMAVETAQLGDPAPPTQTSPANILYALCRDPVGLAVSEAIECDGRSAFDWVTSRHHHPNDIAPGMTLRLDKLVEMVEEEAPTIQNLEAAIDYALSLTPCVEASQREIGIGKLTLLD
jgi:hypothetical protein